MDSDISAYEDESETLINSFKKKELLYYLQWNTAPPDIRKLYQTPQSMNNLMEFIHPKVQPDGNYPSKCTITR